MYRTARKTYPPRKAVTGPRTNQFPAPCQDCGQDVPGGQGILYRDGGKWQVKHRPASWHGSPVSGRYVNGCPEDTARQNLAGQWGAYAEPHCADSTHAAQVTATGGCDSCNREVACPRPAQAELVWCEAVNAPAHGNGPHALKGNCRNPHNSGTYAPAQAPEGADLAGLSRRAGGKYAYTASGARMTLSSRRCEDAPCCGCCD